MNHGNASRSLDTVCKIHVSITEFTVDYWNDNCLQLSGINSMNKLQIQYYYPMIFVCNFQMSIKHVYLFISWGLAINRILNIIVFCYVMKMQQAPVSVCIRGWIGWRRVCKMRRRICRQASTVKPYW